MNRRGDPNVLISFVASTAAAALALTAVSAWHLIQARPWTFLVFSAVTIALQLTSVEVYGRGAVGQGGTGLLAVGFALGSGPAMAVGALMGISTLLARRGRLNRGVFDAAQFTLSAGTGAAVYHALLGSEKSSILSVFPAFAAAVTFMLVNTALLSLAMGMAEGQAPIEVWRERFRWRTPYYMVSGPLAFALVRAYDSLGVTGLLAFALPPLMMMVAIRQYVSRTQQSVEEIRAANEELRTANEQLAERNEDLHALLELASGLAATSHDMTALQSYAEKALFRLTGALGEIEVGGHADGIPLVAGGNRVGGLRLDGRHGFDLERWNRLSEALLPQLATALESAQLVEEVQRRHLSTIAALSRSMEAKDYYTGGHTERVADVAVAIARRLGIEGGDLDAIEVGALLHDIGKIGIPESVLHKPAPLDDEEWLLMRKHPVISDYILSEVDLHPYVRQIARHSHERFDGRGYPDRLGGDEIPLAARIVLVADALDALTSTRPYRTARPLSIALAEIREHAGTQFCPDVVAALEQAVIEEPDLFRERRPDDGDAVAA